MGKRRSRNERGSAKREARGLNEKGAGQIRG